MKKIPIINQRIKDKRKELKITQEDFTKIINKSIATVRRYDTGDIMPDNVIISICNKLNIDLNKLAQEQIKENDLLNTNYYDDFIKKLIKAYETALDLKAISNRINEKKLESIYSSLISNSDIYPILVKYRDNKYYVTNTKNDNTIDILTSQETSELLKELQEYFEFKIEKRRKEKLNRKNFNIVHELGHMILKNSEKKDDDKK